jgi:2-polyprenyl-3-methyl-5-hydroxy-6-metoxy-1,4-benzoquinol methylase
MKTKLYFDKHEPLVRFCIGKKVLDLGVVDHDTRYELGNRWLHKDLKKVSRKILGVDIDKISVNKLNEKGYEIKVANVENFDLGEKFEVIVGGDIIEHLNNVGNFLSCIKKHMDRESIFLLTTPNCLSFSNWLELLLFDRIKYINEEHTLWFDQNTIRRSLENHGFRVEESSFIIHNPHFLGEEKFKYMLKKVRYGMHVMFCLLRKQLAPTIMIKARLK